MRWNQLADDIPRALALADVLCSAAMADSKFHESERIIVGAMLMKVLGVTLLPPEVETYIDNADKAKIKLADACARLDLTSDKEKRSLLKVVAEIVKADDKVLKSERGFVTRLAKVLGMPADEAQAFLD